MVMRAYPLLAAGLHLLALLQETLTQTCLLLRVVVATKIYHPERSQFCLLQEKVLPAT